MIDHKRPEGHGGIFYVGETIDGETVTPGLTGVVPMVAALSQLSVGGEYRVWFHFCLWPGHERVLSYTPLSPALYPLYLCFFVVLCDFKSHSRG